MTEVSAVDVIAQRTVTVKAHDDRRFRVIVGNRMADVYVDNDLERNAERAAVMMFDDAAYGETLANMLTAVSKAFAALNEPERPTMEIPFTHLKGYASMPTPAHVGDAGNDLCCIAPFEIAPHETKMIPVGIAVAIPEGYAGLVIPRSGLAAKHSITVLNSPGLIDSGYRGELNVILHNLGHMPVMFETGDRIAQLVIVSYAPAEFRPVDSVEALGTTDRGDGGFGSTGA